MGNIDFNKTSIECVRCHKRLKRYPIGVHFILGYFHVGCYKAWYYQKYMNISKTLKIKLDSYCKREYK